MNINQVNKNECASSTVLRAVAAYSGKSPLELDPLYDSIDPDTLDALMRNESDICISFDYHGFSVTVAAERVRIE